MEGETISSPKGDAAVKVDAAVQAQRKARRRERVERGISPGQRTTRSVNKGRRNKRPGKGHRQEWRRDTVW